MPVTVKRDIPTPLIPSSPPPHSPIRPPPQKKTSGSHPPHRTKRKKESQNRQGSKLHVGAWKSAAFAQDHESLLARNIAFHQILSGGGG